VTILPSLAESFLDSRLPVQVGDAGQNQKIIRGRALPGIVRLFSLACSSTMRYYTIIMNSTTNQPSKGTIITLQRGGLAHHEGHCGIGTPGYAKITTVKMKNEAIE
jgi:hypothetical protein